MRSVIEKTSKYSMADGLNDWSALFVDSLSTDCAVFVDRLPVFWPAEVA